jgi:hypothetical protein
VMIQPELPKYLEIVIHCGEGFVAALTLV